ncbi:MAG TPA: Hsp70 family protein, partial [Stellaceae bacterium]
AKGAAVAVALGGTAELLPGADGARRLAMAEPRDVRALLLALRERAEKALARPVTHAVIAAERLDDQARGALAQTAEAAGLTLLRVLGAADAAALARGARAEDAPVLGAAIQAEDDMALLQPR